MNTRTSIPTDPGTGPHAGNRFDVLVVGGSFAGLSAALQVARTRRPIAVVDDAQPRNRFAEAAHGFYAQDGTDPLRLMAQARERLLAYPNVRFIQDRVLSAEGSDGAFEARTVGGEQLQAAKLVLAYGVDDVLPEIPGLQERWGRSVLHCPYCHGYEVGGGRLGVLASDEMAAHKARLITDWGRVTLLLNGLALDDATRAQLETQGIAVEPAPIAALEGALPGLTGARLQDGRLVPLDALFVNSRTRPRSPLAEQLGCALDDAPFGPIVRTDTFKQTTVPGVYAAGDIARGMHNATFASADGVMAGVGAHQQLVFGGLPGH